MNPHFDQNRLIWKDEYSGLYKAPQYNEQFEKQWNMTLQEQEWAETPGSSTSYNYIADRIYEWTGKHPNGDEFYDPSMGSRVLDHPLDENLIKGKRCLDLCCGVGRWTRVMQELGAREVLSTDISNSALKAVSRFNSNTCKVNLMNLPEEQPAMVGAFQFVNCWGVVMCTHDPKLAFENAAATVAPGGALFLMVYSPEGMHNTRLVNIQRKIFHSIKTVEERMKFLDTVWRRNWNSRYPLKDNLKGLLARIRKEDRGYKIAYQDMLAPVYNWVVPFETINKWFADFGFEHVIHLNEIEKPKCAHHVLGIKKRG